MTKAEKKQRLQQLKGMLSAVTALASPTAAPIPAAQVVSSLSPDQMKEIISRAAVAQSPAIVPTAASLTPPAQPVYPTCTPLAPSPPSAVPSYSTAPSPYDYEEPAPAVRTTSRASARSRSRKDSGDEDDDEAYGKPSSKVRISLFWALSAQVWLKRLNPMWVDMRLQSIDNTALLTYLLFLMNISYLFLTIFCSFFGLALL